MAKLLKYKIDNQDFFKIMPDTAEGRKLALQEAVGEIIEYDDGVPDPNTIPTQLDRLEAQVAYTAMMTDTLLEV